MLDPYSLVYSGPKGAIALYLPDPILKRMTAHREPPWCLLDHRPLNDKWLPGWWEHAHTAGLGSSPRDLVSQGPVLMLP